MQQKKNALQSVNKAYKIYIKDISRRSWFSVLVVQRPLRQISRFFPKLISDSSSPCEQFSQQYSSQLNTLLPILRSVNNQ